LGALVVGQYTFFKLERYKMHIKCHTIEEFIKVTAGLVREGVTFTSYTYDLTIELTGGF